MSIAYPDPGPAPGAVPFAAPSRLGGRIGRRALAGVAVLVAIAALALGRGAGPAGAQTFGFKMWEGSRSGAAQAGTKVATTVSEWETLWRQLRVEPPPAFDPARQTGVAIYLGTRPTPGYGVHVVATERRGDRLVVVIEETRPAPGSKLPQMITSPYALLLLEGAGGTVTIERRIRD
ncbi:MAG: protease complex subunit PrcB family protein [Rhodospirillales bacterium]|nr:MAG: protease complex subunit PrcB family protein [Rhodospirillales bacterium]